MNIADLLTDSPPLPRIEDPRARFYLDNYRTIETWAALRREVAALLVEGLLDLASVFAADQERLGESIDVLPNDKGTRVILRRPHWITGVGVGLEWTQGVFDRQADVSVYAGLQHDAGEVSENNEERLVKLARGSHSRSSGPRGRAEGAFASCGAGSARGARRSTNRSYTPGRGERSGGAGKRPPQRSTRWSDRDYGVRLRS